MTGELLVKRIAFFCRGFREDVDYSKPEMGNPGIGGTQFMFYIVSNALSVRSNNYEAIFYVEDDVQFPNVETRRMSSFEQVLADASGSVDYLVIRGNASDADLRLIEKSSVSVITWSHNFETAKFLKEVVRLPQIEANVCVGQQQLDRLRDHDAFSKSCVMDNCVCAPAISKATSNERSVCFMGSIVPAKGFHILAQAWPRIVKQVPDAVLKVIGSGDLYAGKIGAFGKLGLAEKSYEDSFSGYITDGSGVLLPNVRLLGRLGGGY